MPYEPRSVCRRRPLADPGGCESGQYPRVVLDEVAQRLADQRAEARRQIVAADGVVPAGLRGLVAVSVAGHVDSEPFGGGEERVQGRRNRFGILVTRAVALPCGGEVL